MSAIPTAATTTAVIPNTNILTNTVSYLPTLPIQAVDYRFYIASTANRIYRFKQNISICLGVKDKVRCYSRTSPPLSAAPVTAL